jgi:hypothetical protein
MSDVTSAEAGGSGDVRWNDTGLSYGDFHVTASYLHGNAVLEEWQTAIEEKMESALAKLALEIRQEFPDVKVRWSVLA